MKHIAIVAGESSGDNLGAPLLNELKKIYPEALFSGVGGAKMQAAGLKSIIDIKRLSVMGLWEVIKHLPDIFAAKNELLTFWQNNPPDIFIGIDAPDFNLRLAKALKNQGVKTVHYVSPSLWAWKEKRIHHIKKNIDLMLCLFPFELEIYQKYGVKALCVGHSQQENLPYVSKAEAREILEIPQDFALISFFVGSRKSEIKRLLPIFLATAEIIRQKNPEIKLAISLLDDEFSPQIPPEISIFRDRSAYLIQASDVVLLKSGTISLESAFLQRPQIVTYKVHPISAYLAKFLLKIKRFSLVNLLLKRDVVPEYIQDDCQPEKLASAVINLFEDKNLQQKQLDAYQELKNLLPKNSSQVAAQAIVEFSQESL